MKRILLLLFCLNCFYVKAQDIVTTDGITENIHRANIGKIIFTSRNIPLNELKESDFLQTYEFNRESNLNIRVFLDNSITNYMHRLAPTLTADELNAKGNYRFTFIVDGKTVYSENIHHGCGLRKSETTTFRVPFTDTSGADWWSMYLWDRFKVNGGDEVLTDGTHNLKVEIRPYVKTDENSEAIVGQIIAQGDLNLFIKKREVTVAETAVQEIQPNSGFVISNAKYDKNRIEELNKNIANETFKQITSIVVLKEGKLLIEEYFNNANRVTLHDTRSVGKSFTSAIMGIAIGDGYIKSGNQTLDMFYNLKSFPNYAVSKDKITLEDLLKMSSSFSGNDSDNASPGNEENMYPTDDWVKFALSLPIDVTKISGKQWRYFTAGVVLLGDILHKSVPDGLEKYADKKLFSPLGITNYEWQYTPQSVANTAGGLKMNALDLAKFGQLYQNNGIWNGKRILPSKWIAKTFSRQLPIVGRANGYYGFLFWNKTFIVNGKFYETYYCSGNGGNKVFVFKNLPLTVVITATAYNRSYAHPQVDKIMQEYILPSILK